MTAKNTFINFVETLGCLRWLFALALIFFCFSSPLLAGPEDPPEKAESDSAPVVEGEAEVEQAEAEGQTAVASSTPAKIPGFAWLPQRLSQVSWGVRSWLAASELTLRLKAISLPALSADKEQAKAIYGESYNKRGFENFVSGITDRQRKEFPQNFIERAASRTENAGEYYTAQLIHSILKSHIEWGSDPTSIWKPLIKLARYPDFGQQLVMLIARYLTYSGRIGEDQLGKITVVQNLIAERQARDLMKQPGADVQIELLFQSLPGATKGYRKDLLGGESVKIRTLQNMLPEGPRKGEIEYILDLFAQELQRRYSILDRLRKLLQVGMGEDNPAQIAVEGLIKAELKKMDRISRVLNDLIAKARQQEGQVRKKSGDFSAPPKVDPLKENRALLKALGLGRLREQLRLGRGEYNPMVAGLDTRAIIGMRTAFDSYPIDPKEEIDQEPEARAQRVADWQKIMRILRQEASIDKQPAVRYFFGKLALLYGNLNLCRKFLQKFAETQDLHSVLPELVALSEKMVSPPEVEDVIKDFKARQKLLAEEKAAAEAEKLAAKKRPSKAKQAGKKRGKKGPKGKIGKTTAKPAKPGRGERAGKKPVKKARRPKAEITSAALPEVPKITEREKLLIELEAEANNRPAGGSEQDTAKGKQSSKQSVETPQVSLDSPIADVLLLSELNRGVSDEIARKNALDTARKIFQRISPGAELGFT